jgi:membrane associated rhomboid family serine protease
MLLIPATIELAEGELPARSTPVVWIWLSLVLALFVVERLVVIDHDLHLGLLPESLFAGVTFVVASWSLYGDPALFDLWQVWSHLLVHLHWWQLAVEVVLMLVIGRALERTLGSALFAAVIGCLGPLGGVVMVLLVGVPVYVGAMPLMLGLLGVILGRLPGAMTRWGIAWWAIVAVGWWPLFRMPLHTLGFLLLVLVLATTPAGRVPSTLLVSVLLVAVGLGIGALMRRSERGTARDS